RRKSKGTREGIGNQDLRNEEVLRANRELAAYFKGKRTEREARAALKTIKAYVRDRERCDPVARPPLPGTSRLSTGKNRNSESKESRLHEDSSQPESAEHMTATVRTDTAS